MINYRVTVLVLVCFVSVEVVFGQQSNGPECKLPQKFGSCNKRIRRFYYDSNAGECKQFFYSGCDGNLNNFGSLERCNSRCLCSQPMLDGKGNLNLVRFYYNVKDGRCLRFRYRGSGGNENNFLSRNACNNRCTRDKTEENCEVRPDKGTSCSETSSIQYYYDKHCNCCHAFKFKGCGGNGNKYPTNEMCLQTCGSEGPSEVERGVRPERCLDQPQYGTCQNITIRYYYDERLQKCTEFIYSGCDGNRNNFRTMRQCNKNCIRNITGPVGVTFNNRDGQISAVLSGSKEVNAVLIDSGISLEFQNGTFVNEAQNPTVRSDSTIGKLLAEFGGLDSAAFGTDVVVKESGIDNIIIDTATTTKTNATPAECLLVPDIGNCLYRLDRYYFDQKLGACRRFFYSGCGGNSNRFFSEAHCQSKCIMH